MAHYIRWNHDLTLGSDAYLEKEGQLFDGLRAIRHAVDYHYAAIGERVPDAVMPSGEGKHLFLGDLVALREVKCEDQIVARLAQHLAADSVDEQVLRDVTSLLRIGSPEEAGYARVFFLCAQHLRAMFGPEGQATARHVPFRLDAGSWYAADFLDESLGAPARRSSPVLVASVTPLLTGRGELALSLVHSSHPSGIADAEYRLLVLDRGATYLLARSLTHQPARVICFTALTASWLEERAWTGFPPKPEHGKRTSQPDA